ncbi:nuclear transport factor 2 family protein [Streptomyces sp. NPDC085932]|uniref:nuclear transport factor 2 family protein n=1 Tax=Streptomyces sp. NPDC085932 TaxID=3365741 RepID=UPI0037D1E436
MYVTTHCAIPSVGEDHLVQEIRHRAEIADALYRFALGQDLKDRELFLAAFTPDAELDFRPAAEKIGTEPVLFSGRSVIVDNILGLFAGRIDTTHTVSNPRISLSADEAGLTALVEAQHVLIEDRRTYALLKNLYDVDLVRENNRWLIRRLVIENVWFIGNPKAIFVG